MNKLMAKLVAAVVATVLLAGACGGGNDGAGRGGTGNGAGDRSGRTGTEAPAQATISTVAEAKGGSVAVYATPGAATAARTLKAPAPGAPLVLLVVGRQAGWLQVSLPVRPNGSTGWVREGDVSLSEHDYRVVVRLGAHRLQVFRGTELLVDEPAAVGKAATPTPTGRFFTVDLIQPANPHGPYGPYAYVLSAYSETLTEFAGGDGVVGIHGTNEPGLLGTDASHGCIRVSNRAIEAMVDLLPLGTPVEITA